MKKILGIGNALVDILISLPNDDLLSKFSLKKGSMQLVDDKFASEIENACKEFKRTIASGGSGANAMHGAARLGVHVGYIGKISSDDYGVFFKNDLIKSSIKAYLATGNKPTGRAVTLVTPDSERTFATYLGSAADLITKDIKPGLLKKYDYLLAEGYLVFNNELIENIFIKAKETGMKIAIDLSSYNIVETNIDFLKRMAIQYVDILFANEEEAKAFTGNDPEEALDEIAEICDIAVVKVGKEGSFVKSKQEKHKIESITAKSIDTTGAGDLYAGGFLYGLVKNMPLNVCGEIGSLLAGNVIEGIGAKIHENRWDKLEREVMIKCKL